MSNYLTQAGKDNLNNPVFVAEGVPKAYHNPKIGPPDHIDVNKQGLATAQPVAATHLGSAMPEQYMSAGGYYPNGAGFAMSFPNFNQPNAQWSTGTNNPQAAQNFDHTAMQYSTLGAAPSAQTNADVTQNHQYVAADHLFNQNNSAYQNAFSAAPYMNGNWSYFNNPSSFFFPTAGDLNLNWGTATADNPNGNALFQDLYKPPPPPSEQDKTKVEIVSEHSIGLENGDSHHRVDNIEQSLNNMSVSSNEKEVEKNSEISAPTTTTVNATPAVTPVVQPSKPPPVNPTGQSNAPTKPVSWAAVASQPAKSKPPPKKPVPKEVHQPVQTNKPNYSSQNGTVSNRGKQQQQNGRWNNNNRHNQGSNNNSGDVEAVINDSHLDINRLKDATPLLKKLMTKYNFNPRDFNMDFKNARFFIIKSYSEDDIFRSIKYSSWTSTEHGNRRLNDAFKEQQKTGVKTPMYLLFSVNSSGHFCGVAEMKSEVDLNVETGIWVQDKWKGRFDVRWIYVKDVPNNILRHIRLENNENKPVTNSRDTQEVRPDKGTQVLKIMHNYKAQTSIFDDFAHYEKRQEEDAKMRSKKMPEPAAF